MRTSTALAILGAAQAAYGHTWIEQLRNINAQGEYVGEYGYPRGMVDRLDSGFSGNSMNWELPAYDNPTGGPFISETTNLCHASQRKQQQSQDKYPRLKAPPGGFMAMRYAENGHVSLPGNQKGKPEKGGTIFVYGTTEPKDDEKLATVLRWTQDGQGGDKRGKLLGTNDYDDGRCHQINASPISKERQTAAPNHMMGQTDGPGNVELLCETNAALPKDAQAGKPYTIYWVWQWNSKAGADPGLPIGKDEYYTTCIDIEVADALAKDKPKADFALGQQDAMSVAVKGFASRTAIQTDPFAFEQGPVFNSTPTATGGAPAPTQPAPAPPQTTLATSVQAPFSNSTGPQIPTITKPGDKPTNGPSDDNVVRVTVTEKVTVTAPVVTQTAPARKRAAHINRHGARFRFSE